MSKLLELISATIDGEVNTAENVERAFAEMLSGDASPVRMASFLTALRTRGAVSYTHLTLPTTPYV